MSSRIMSKEDAKEFCDYLYTTNPDQHTQAMAANLISMLLKIIEEQEKNNG